MRLTLSKGKIAAVAIALTFAAAGIYVETRTLNSMQRNAQAPTDPVEILLAQQMTTPEGTVQSLAQWKDRPLVVNFWATWCAPCVEEMPALSRLQQTLTPQTVQIIGIGIDTSANIQAFATRYGISYPILVAGTIGMDLMRQLGNQTGGLPYSLLIDSNGKVVHTYLGKLDMKVLQRDITALPPRT